MNCWLLLAPRWNQVLRSMAIKERGGLMEIKYSIAVEHTVTGRNCFKIRVRRKH